MIQNRKLISVVILSIALIFAITASAGCILPSDFSPSNDSIIDGTTDIAKSSPVTTDAFSNDSIVGTWKQEMIVNGVTYVDLMICNADGTGLITTTQNGITKSVPFTWSYIEDHFYAVTKSENDSFSIITVSEDILRIPTISAIYIRQ